MIFSRFRGIPSGQTAQPDLDSPHAMVLRKNAPTNVVWIVSLALYLIAVLAHFRIVRVDGAIASWSWIAGFALLLIATKVRRL